MVHKILLGALVVSSPLMAQSTSIQGSDTLAGFVSDVIVASGLESKLVYQGGGSGKGEDALVNGQQGIAPMSREMKDEALAKAKAKGIKVIEHTIGLDGIAVFVNDGNSVKTLDLAQVKKIYSCTLTNWSQVGGQNQAIVVYRRNDASGTTDTFKTLVGIKEFGSCVKVVSETSDIAAFTSSNVNAIGYAGLSAGRDGNKALSLAKKEGGKAYVPTPGTIRNFNYPLARKLYVYEASGSVKPSAAEATLLGNMLDRSFADPLLQDNEFFTLD